MEAMIQCSELRSALSDCLQYILDDLPEWEDPNDTDEVLNARKALGEIE